MIAEHAPTTKALRCNAVLRQCVIVDAIGSLEPSMRLSYRLLLTVVALLLAACASPGPAARMASRLAQVEALAGAPVESFHFWHLDSWESLGRRHLLVHTRINEGWLLQVDEPCPGLEFAVGIGLSSTSNRVYSRFDSVLFDRQRCRIADIRPVDIKALRTLRRQEREASE
jgi:hypothetical protein